jgi:ATP-dependent Clp protease ATP-binding subunit ClpA
MATRFAPQARSIVSDAEAQARSCRSPAIEAEHLLLALSQSDTEASRVLASLGLTHQAIQEALSREFEQALDAAGVRVRAGTLGRPSPEPHRRPRLGASSKGALERALAAAAGSHQIRPGHLLLGVLGARYGTVPRALHLAGVDQLELEARTRQALGD